MCFPISRKINNPSDGTYVGGCVGFCCWFTHGVVISLVSKKADGRLVGPEGVAHCVGTILLLEEAAGLQVGLAEALVGGQGGVLLASSMGGRYMKSG